MALAIGASTSTGFTSANSTTTSAITTQAETSIYVLAHWESSSAVPTITDSKGNTYTQVGTTRENLGTYNNWCGLWRCEGATGGASHTVTASKASGYASVYVIEVPGARIRHYNQGGAGASPYGTGSITTTVSSFLLSFFGYQNTANSSHSITSGWAIEEEITSVSFWQGAVASRAAASAGSHQAVLTVSGGSPDDGGGFIIELYEADTDDIGDDVVSLLLFNGSDGSTTFTDSASARTWTAAGGAALDTGASAHGGSAGYFPTTSDWISTPDDVDLRMGSDDFCIEGWFRPTASGAREFFVKGINTPGGLGLFLSTSEARFRCNGTSDMTYSGSISSTQFTHVAFCRTGINRYIFVNGALVASATGVTTIDDTSTVFVGAVEPSNSLFRYTGWIDSLRITKGNRRYTEKFIVPNHEPPVPAGASTVTADASLTWGALALSADAGVLVTADAAISWGALTLDATASTAAEITADADLAWGALTADATAGVLVQADAALAFGALQIDATAAALVSADASLSFGALAITADATAAVAADAALQWGSIALASDGSVLVTADGTIGFSALALSADAGVLVAADAALEWGALTLDATASTDHGINADASLTWGALVLSSDASALVAANASMAWGAIAVSSDASVALSADAALQWAPLALDAQAAVLVQAEAAVEWGALQLDASAVHTPAQLDASLAWGAITLDADASALVAADASLSWGALQPAATGAVLVQVDAALTWAPITLAASAYAGGEPFPAEPRLPVTVATPVRVVATGGNDRTTATIDQQRAIVTPGAAARLTVTYGD